MGEDAIVVLYNQDGMVVLHISDMEEEVILYMERSQATNLAFSLMEMTDKDLGVE